MKLWWLSGKANVGGFGIRRESIRGCIIVGAAGGGRRRWIELGIGVS